MRQKWRSPILTIVIGALVVPTVAAAGLYVWLFLRSIVRYPTLEHLTTLFLLWQTQTGAAFAVAAALIGAAAVLQQTATTRGLEEERRTRRAAALRAVLPLLLTELIDYAVQCAVINAGLLTQGASSPVKALDLQFPALPAGIVDRLTDIIEASDENQARPLIILSKRVQIHHSRMQDTQRRAGGNHGSILLHVNVVHRMIDSAEIHARCGQLLVYARSVTNAPAATITSSDVKKALSLIPVGLPNVTALENEIDRFATNGESGMPWPEI